MATLYSLCQTVICSRTIASSSQVVNKPLLASDSSVDAKNESLSTSGETIAVDDVNATINSSQSDNVLTEWRRQLPLELQNKTKTLQRIVFPGLNGCRVEVYLLGTAHVSIDSSKDVQILLETVDPSVVFLELCDQRIPMMLTPPPVETTTTTTLAEETETTPKTGFWNRIRGRKNNKRKKASSRVEGSRSMYGLAAGMLTSMQQDYASSLGVELGGEFRVAYNYWEEKQREKRIHMILGDRPLYLTLTRAWEALGLWGKAKLVVALLMSSFQKPNPAELQEWMQKILADDTGDLLTESIAELAKHFPTLEQVIIQERDAYMASKLYQTCRQLLQPHPQNQQPPQVQKLVAIVGAGHVQGMCKLLTEANGKLPEEMLESLIDIKKSIPDEDRRVLIYDVLEVNYEQLEAMAEELRASISADK